MLWQTFGMTRDTAGSAVKSLLEGNAVNGWLAEAGTDGKSVQGACLRAEFPLVHTADPAAGRSSAYPVKVWPAAMRSAPRFGPVNVCGQESVVTPCVLPENSAR